MVFRCGVEGFSDIVSIQNHRVRWGLAIPLLRSRLRSKMGDEHIILQEILGAVFVSHLQIVVTQRDCQRVGHIGRVGWMF